MSVTDASAVETISQMDGASSIRSKWTSNNEGPSQSPALPAWDAWHWTYFWTSGFAVLFVWSCLLSMTDYLKRRFDPECDKYIPFFFNFGGFLIFIVYGWLNKRISFRLQLILLPILLVIIFVVIILIGEKWDASGAPFLKLATLLSLVTLSGSANGLLQTSIIRHAFKFTYLEISYYAGGNALSGIAVSGIALVSCFLIPADELFLNAMFYLAFVILVSIGLLYIFLKYLGGSYIRAEDYFDKLAEMQTQQLATSISKSNPIESDDGPKYFQTLKKIQAYFFHMIFIFSVTLGVYPSMAFAMGLNMSHISFYQIILMIFNVGDVAGRYLYSKMPLSDNVVPHFLSLIRIGFVVYVVLMFDFTILAPLINNPLCTFLFVFLLSSSHGYIQAGLFSLASERASTTKEKENSGFLMTLALIIGLSYGGLAILVGAREN